MRSSPAVSIASKRMCGGPTGSGTIITGPEFANRDYVEVGNDWTWLGHVFRSPDQTVRGQVRVGQWEATGSVQFDAVRITPVVAVHRQVGRLVLGEGEIIRNGQYEFSAAFDHEGSNYHRRSSAASAGFNSDRWCFGGDDQVTYRFGLPGHRFLSGEVEFLIGYHVRGGCAAEVSRDQKKWQSLVTQSGLGTGRARLPAQLLPAETLFLRLKSATARQRSRFTRSVSAGRWTARPRKERARPFSPTSTARAGTWPSKGWTLSDSDAEGRPDATSGTEEHEFPAPGGRLPQRGPFRGADAANTTSVPCLWSAGQAAPWSMRIPAAEPGRYEFELTVKTGQGEGAAGPGARHRPRVLSGRLRRAAVGRRGYDGACGGATQRTRFPVAGRCPRRPGRRRRCRRHGTTSRPCKSSFGRRRRCARLTATASPLQGPGGATIPADQIQILWVCYHFVDHPTDATGVRDLWPDALPPLTRPIDVPGGENQPLWVLVHVPRDARPGDYAGQVPCRPTAGRPAPRSGCTFGTSPCRTRRTWKPATDCRPTRSGGIIRRKSEADKRRVFDMYLQCLADHRLSPYQPAPLGPDPGEVPAGGEAAAGGSRFLGVRRGHEPGAGEVSLQQLRPAHRRHGRRHLPISRGAANRPATARARPSTRPCSQATCDSSKHTSAKRAG